MRRIYLFALLLSSTVHIAQSTAPGTPSTSAPDRELAPRFQGILQEPYRNPSTGHDASDNPSGTVLLHSGEFVLSRTDLDIAGRGMDFEFTRTYRSGSDHNGPLGLGWDANVFMRLEEHGGIVVCFDGSGRADRYYKKPSAAYRSPAGLYTQLIKDGSGFSLRDRDGMLARFDLDGKLTSVRDRQGNTHDYSYDGLDRLIEVRDSFGRAIDFTYASTRLTQVTDFTGRVVEFTYDGLDRLTQARSPLVTTAPTGATFPNGKREQYTYTGGKLTGVVYPNEVEANSSTPALVNTYGSKNDADLERVIMQSYGGTNGTGIVAGGTLSFEYEFGNGPYVVTTVTDREGNETEYHHSRRGHALVIIEEPDSVAPFVTSYQYNLDGEITRKVMPLGGETLFVYDSANPDRFQQGNLLTQTQLPDARGGDQTQIVCTYTYEPLFNQIRTQTQPRGNDAGYVPPNGGVNSPARYTTSYVYDYMEGAMPAEAVTWLISILPSLLNLGDINGDGLTNQNKGNVVRTERPTVNLLAGSKQAALEGDMLQEIFLLHRYNAFGQLVRSEDPRGNVDVFQYFPENDPDGDGLDLILGADPTSGGYRSSSTRDALIGPNRQDPGPALVLVTSNEYDARGNVTRRTDPRGNDNLFEYNELDQLVVEEDPKLDLGMSTGFQRRHGYDANDNRVVLEVGNWKPDASGIPFQDPLHPWFLHTWLHDILDNIVSETQDATRDGGVPPSVQPEMLTMDFRYDANDNLVRQESPLATNGTDTDNVRTWTYDERDLMFEETRGSGSADESTWMYEYDENRNMTGITDAVDNDAIVGPETHTRLYDGYDRLVSDIDRAGNHLDVTYDPDGRVTDHVRKGPVDGSNPAAVDLEVVHILYDELGRDYQQDIDLFVPVGAIVAGTVTLGEGAMLPGDGRLNVRTEYDANDRVTFHHEDDGEVYSREYDGADRVVREVKPLNDPGLVEQDIALEYDANDNIVRLVETHVSPEGHGPPAFQETFCVFDALDRMVRETDPLGQTTYVEYDSRDNVVATYDARGPMMSDPLGLFGGDINDRGNPVRTCYDGLGRPWLKLEELHVAGQGDMPLDTSNPAIPSGMIEKHWEWDANGRCVSETDGNGNATVYGFDSLDRRTSQTNAMGCGRMWLFDADDHATSMTDENGTVHSFTYDGLDRLVRHDLTLAGTTIPGAALPMLVGTTERAFEYDGMSRRTLSYDNNEPGDVGDDWVVETVYDSLGRMIEQRQNGRAVTSCYDSDDRSLLAYPGAGRMVSFVYDALDQPTVIEDARAQIQQNYMGDCPCPIVSQCASFPGPNVALQCQNQLNPKKLVEQTVATTPSAGFIALQSHQRERNDRTVFSDFLYQSPSVSLVRARDDSLNSINQVQFHQLLDPTEITPLLQVYDVQYGAAQEILDVFDGVTSIINNVFDDVYVHLDAPFDYDGANSCGTGIRTQDGDYFYQWDGLNRLRVVTPVATPSIPLAEYDYDADPCVVGGRRVRAEGPLSGETRFYYDSIHCIEETVVSGTEDVKVQFLYDPSGADNVLAMDLDTNSDGLPDALFFYVRDANNNVTHLVDSAGLPAEFYFDDMFQVPLIIDASSGVQTPGSSFENPYMYQGRRFDAETGLYYFRGRYYDPEDAEFLSRDPLGFWGDSHANGNPMSFEANTFQNGGDPLGLKLTHKLTQMGGKGAYKIYDGKNLIGIWFPLDNRLDYWVKGKKYRGSGSSLTVLANSKGGWKRGRPPIGAKKATQEPEKPIWTVLTEAYDETINKQAFKIKLGASVWTKPLLGVDGNIEFLWHCGEGRGYIFLTTNVPGASAGSTGATATFGVVNGLDSGADYAGTAYGGSVAVKVPGGPPITYGGSVSPGGATTFETGVSTGSGVSGGATHTWELWRGESVADVIGNALFQ